MKDFKEFLSEGTEQLDESSGGSAKGVKASDGKTYDVVAKFNGSKMEFELTDVKQKSFKRVGFKEMAKLFK